MEVTIHVRVSASKVFSYLLYLQCVLNAIWHSRLPQKISQLSAVRSIAVGAIKGNIYSGAEINLPQRTALFWAVTQRVVAISS